MRVLFAVLGVSADQHCACLVVVAHFSMIPVGRASSIVSGLPAGKRMVSVVESCSVFMGSRGFAPQRLSTRSEGKPREAHDRCHDTVFIMAARSHRYLAVEDDNNRENRLCSVTHMHSSDAVV